MALKTRRAPRKPKAPEPAAGKPPVSAAKAATRALTPSEEMDLLFDRLSRGFMSRIGLPAHGESVGPSMINAPKVDLIDRGNEFVVRAEIPGVAKDDLKIRVGVRSCLFPCC